MMLANGRALTFPVRITLMNIFSSKYEMPEGSGVRFRDATWIIFFGSGPQAPEQVDSAGEAHPWNRIAVLVFGSMATVAMPRRDQIFPVGQAIGTIGFGNMRQRLEGLKGFLNVPG